MTTATPHFETLMSQLNRQVSYTYAFIHILDQEQAGLLKMGMSVLMQISKQKENGLRQMIYLDEQIQETAAAITGTEARDEKEIIQLRDLYPHLQPHEVDELDEIRQTLGKLRGEIDRKSYINHSFTEDILCYLGDAISLISEGVSCDPSYSSRGLPSKIDKAGPSLLSCEV